MSTFWISLGLLVAVGAAFLAIVVAGAMIRSQRHLDRRAQTILLSDIDHILKQLALLDAEAAMLATAFEMKEACYNSLDRWAKPIPKQIHGLQCRIVRLTDEVVRVQDWLAETNMAEAALVATVRHQHPWDSLA